MLIVESHECVQKSNLDNIVCVDSYNKSNMTSSICKMTNSVCGDLVATAKKDAELLQYNEPDFHRISLNNAAQKMLMVNQALDLLSEMKNKESQSKDDLNGKTMANLEYLLLRLQGILSTVVFHKTWKAIYDELLKFHISTNSHFGGDKSCSEYSSGKRPQSTTWPWSIKTSLAVLWGVCWMFEMAIYPHQLPGWAMNPVKVEEYAYPGMTSAQPSPNPQQSLMSAAATGHASHHSNNNNAAISSSLGGGNTMSWRVSMDGVNMTNQLGGTAETSAAAVSAPRGAVPAPNGLGLLSANHVMRSSSGSTVHSQRELVHGHAGSGGFKNTISAAALPPHPSGHISISPQAASLEIHHHLPVSTPTLPSVSVSSNTHLAPVPGWPTPNLATSDQGLGIKHQSPGSSPYRPYNVLPTRTPPTCSPASQPLFAATGTWCQPNAYRDPTTTPSTPGYLNRSSFDGSLPNIIQPDFSRHQAIISGSERSFDISTLSYPPSPAHTVAHMDSITADAVLAARTVADMSNAATNGGHVDDSMEDAMDGFSSRRGHTHKRSEEPPRDDSGKMICRFQNSCSGLTFERKCEWSKHMDKHERPYKCEAPGCEKLQGFTYSGGLLRHQREVHKMHGGTKEPLHCPFENCKRAGGQGFTRKENLQEHIRRVHRRNTDGVELIAGSKRELETLELTDPLLRSELGGHDEMVDEVGAENIDPSVSSITGTPNPAKRRRIHVNGTPIDGSLEDADFRSLAKRLQDQNSMLTKHNDQLRRDVQSLSERMSKIESWVGRRMLEEMNQVEEQD